MSNRGVNKAILVGRVGADPTVGYMLNGSCAVNFSLATTESWKDQSGERQERTEWHYICIFGRLAEVMGELIHKGSHLYIEGKIKTSKWTDKAGVERYKTQIIADEVQLLGAKTDRPASEESGGSYPSDNRAAQQADSSFDDEIPF